MTTIELDNITLGRGSHPNPEAGMCLMEAVAFVRGIEFSDSPPCVSRILGTFGRNLNDTLPDDKRQELKPFIPRLIGTAGDPDKDQVRGLMAADWLIRVYTPTWLRLAGLEAEALSLETLERQASWDDVAAAVPVARAARERAREARISAGDAAGDAAGAAAWAAAWDAAGDAAGAAARDAAWAAAWDAAWAAARAAARDAARAHLAPTVAFLQDSAIELFDRMIEAA